MTTNAMRMLKAMGVCYRTIEYVVDEEDLSAESVAAKLGMDPDMVFKTLVVVGDKSGPFMCVVPGSAELNLRKTAKASGNKSVALLPLRMLEPLTGYIRGGCSPLGAKRTLAVYMDETAQLWDSISVSAGARGIQILLAPADLLRATEGVYADLV
jgi:Cys-tRNA(Pro)/Cys-tRNA(Cys) deacylase